jgi:hypothetical protein
MNFPLSLEAWGTPEFKDVLVEELGEERSHFPFEDYLRSGGCVEGGSADFHVESFRELEGVIHAECIVYFNEEVTGSCRDQPWPEERRGNFTLKIDKETGEGTAERNYDCPTYSGENY